VRTIDTDSDVLGFIMDRLRAIQLEAGHGSEAFDAVQATSATRPIDIQARLVALQRFRQLPEAESLAAANKRIANILKKSAADSSPASVDAALLQEMAEKDLAAALDRLAPEVHLHLDAGRYDDALTLLAGLRPMIDAFFNDVMVNDPDTSLRTNRLALVNRVRTLFSGVADFSRLPG
jgi:glycyl-tRNA synthetase beta chain